MLDKLRDLRVKAKRIEASQPNPKKKAQMLMALAKVDFITQVFFNRVIEFTSKII